MNSKLPLKLNLGCGANYRAGYVNVDWSRSVKTDKVVDLSEFPWPWPDNSADEIFMWHVLEHLMDTGKVMREVSRILKPGGKFWGQVPYGPSHDGRTHWQHYRHFVARSFKEMASDNDLTLVSAKNGVNSINWHHKLRNLVPSRELLALTGWSEAFDLVDFLMVKPMTTKG